MPELPDVTVYVERLAARCVGQTLERVRVVGPSLLRSVDPPLSAVEGTARARRAQARQAHRVRARGRAVPGPPPDDRRPLPVARARRAPVAQDGLASLDFATGTLTLTEASTQKRATLHLVRGEEALAEHDPGGLEPLDATLDAFRARLRAENHTLKRALTDPRIFSGIGNAYSDEILHRARLSPVSSRGRLSDEECRRLYVSTREMLEVDRAAARPGRRGLPEKVTAFRPEMAVHGRYREPCPDCGAPVQRIAYADNETNYCARCQTGGKLLADRALSRLLKKDWPKTLEELEALRGALDRRAAGPSGGGQSAAARRDPPRRPRPRRHVARSVGEASAHGEQRGGPGGAEPPAAGRVLPRPALSQREPARPGTRAVGSDRVQQPARS